MNLPSILQAAGPLFGAMALLALIEVGIPLRARTAWSRSHLAANLTLTVVTLAANLLIGLGLVFALALAQREGWGLFKLFGMPAWATLAGGVIAFDLSWYVTHRTMHETPLLWRIHSVHHSDPMVDVTTTSRQHPLELMFRAAVLLVFGLALGVPPAALVIYRTWATLQGLFDHANIRLPGWLDEAITWVSASPNMHKVHHSKDPALTNTNYSAIISAWDRLFGTFTPPSRGLAIDYGLDGYERADRQSLIGLLGYPFRTARAAASSPEA
jgi:sterol desaturase/sphingolipid hydroxylase (fatty acid hydroxylase superfamily)